MNREHQSPTDPIFEPETPEAAQRLDEIERRLKAVRPRPPRLDVATLERLAREAPLDTAVCPRPSGRMAVMAGSWACGAVVGALVMFVLLNPTVSDTDSTEETVRIEKEPPMPAARDQNAPPDVEEEIDRRERQYPLERLDPLGRDAAVLALSLDRFGSADSAYFSDGPTLWAGMYRIKNAVDRTANATRRFRTEHPPKRNKTQNGSNPEPAPPITRERLMRDLLGNSPEFVL